MHMQKSVLQGILFHLIVDGPSTSAMDHECLRYCVRESTSVSSASVDFRDIRPNEQTWPLFASRNKQVPGYTTIQNKLDIHLYIKTKQKPW